MTDKSGPLAAGDWHKVADEIIGWTARYREPGETAAARMEWVAERAGLHLQTLRRVVAARYFVMSIEQEDYELGVALRGQPYTAIEPLAKWVRYDKVAAVAEARRLIAGEHTVRSIAAAEGAARARADRPLNAREWVATVIEAVARKTPGYRLAEKDKWRTSSIDAVLEPTDGEGHLVMLLIVGPYSTNDLYERKRLDILLIAAGLVKLGHQVLIILPKGVATKTYRAWIASHRIEGIYLKTMA